MTMGCFAVAKKKKGRFFLLLLLQYASRCDWIDRDTVFILRSMRPLYICTRGIVTALDRLIATDLAVNRYACFYLHTGHGKTKPLLPQPNMAPSGSQGTVRDAMLQMRISLSKNPALRTRNQALSTNMCPSNSADCFGVLSNVS